MHLCVPRTSSAKRADAASTILHPTAAPFSTAFALLTVLPLRAHAEAILVALVAELIALVDDPPREEADPRVGAVAVRRAHRAEVEVRVT
eukprot:scaffold26232_cov71-Phaeocystis_antarctica.AAC.3